jgi:O-Antigen ligase
MAVVAIPISVASKFVLGMTGTTWIDPTLLLALAALLALFSRWGDFLAGPLRPVLLGAAVLCFLSVVCAFSGAVLRPPPSLYSALREPLRLLLNLCWFLVSCWFLVYRPRVILLSSILAVTFGLAAGIYFYLVAFGVAPAPASVVTYTRAYLLRQTIWFNGIPIPRMGGLFFEAPPFGLFMFSMGAVLFLVREKGIYSRWTAWGITLAVLGVLLSLADQVLLAATVGLLFSLPRMGKRHPGIAWPIAIVLTIAVCAFEFQSITVKESSATTGIVTRVNGGSVSERSFHINYGLHLLEAHPAASLFGIGPGRYGEYAGETGYFLDTVNMQTSELEVLVEWGVIGLTVWIALLGGVAARVWEVNGVLGVGLLLGLILADSFQANWKYEAVFLAIGALSMGRAGYAEVTI